MVQCLFSKIALVALGFAFLSLGVSACVDAVVRDDTAVVSQEITAGRLLPNDGDLAISTLFPLLLVKKGFLFPDKFHPEDALSRFDSAPVVGFQPRFFE